jgi:hypothetical protein
MCGHLQLFRVRQLDPQVRDLGLTLGGEHLLNRVLDTGGGLDPLHMRQNLRADRLKEIPEHELIPRNP